MVIITHLDDCIAKSANINEINKIEEENMGNSQERIDKLIKISINKFKKSDKFKEIIKSTEDRAKYLAICEKKFVDEQINKRKFFMVGDIGSARKKKYLFGYHNGIYIPEGDAFIATDYDRLFTNIETLPHSKQVNEIINKTRTRVYDVDNLELNVTKNILCLKNGCYNFNTNKFEPHNPDYILVNKFPIFYNKTIKISDNALKFFSNLCGEDSEKLDIMQKFMGSIFLTNNQFKVFLMVYGETNSGKSTFSKFLRALFRDKKHVSGVRLNQFKDNRFILSHFFGKVLNICGDTDKMELKNAAIGNIKTLLGEDLITAEKKGQDPFDYENQASLIIMCNEIPTIKSTDNAFWKKMLLFKFAAEFDNTRTQDEVVAEITTQEEISGIFNWCLEGLYKLKNEGGFNINPFEVQREYDMIDAGLKIDSVYHFIADTFKISEGNHLIKKDVYNNYVIYTKDEPIEDKYTNEEEFNSNFKFLCKKSGLKTSASKVTKNSKSHQTWKDIDFVKFNKIINV